MNSDVFMNIFNMHGWVQFVNCLLTSMPARAIYSPANWSHDSHS